MFDRMQQNAIFQVLKEKYEDKFPDNSFGFRPERICHNAIDRVLEIADEG